MHTINSNLFLLALFYLLLASNKVSSYDEEELHIKVVNYVKVASVLPAGPPVVVAPTPLPPVVTVPTTPPAPVKAPTPPTTVKPPVAPPPPAAPIVKSKKDCIPLCDYRCKLHSRKNTCVRACMTCCDRCKCVPPGTSGNRQVCGKCYTDMLTHGDRPKCP